MHFIKIFSYNHSKACQPIDSTKLSSRIKIDDKFAFLSALIC